MSLFPPSALSLLVSVFKYIENNSLTENYYGPVSIYIYRKKEWVGIKQKRMLIDNSVPAGERLRSVGTCVYRTYRTGSSVTGCAESFFYFYLHYLMCTNFSRHNDSHLPDFCRLFFLPNSFHNEIVPKTWNSIQRGASVVHFFPFTCE